MPRRTATSNLPPSVTSSFARQLVQPPQPPALLELRRQWKWAALSQFFFTFNALFAMNDVSLTDIENDLANSTNVFLPRLVHRLLCTLTQDRKISMENWQTALRKQYYKRDPEANPIGPEPLSGFMRAESVHDAPTPLTQDASAGAGEPSADRDPGPETPSRNATPTPGSVPYTRQGSPVPVSRNSASVDPRPLTRPVDDDEREESKDWLELPMLTKLDTLHHLIEWQFHNPLRLRAAMKDDDETAQWRIEPVGYDSQRNAYWLIGADRLWIQREPPKPPKSLKRKRTNNSGSKNAKASTSAKPAANASPKKKRAKTTLRAKGTGGSDASARPAAAQPEAAAPPPRGRAAKIQANMKLDVHAKAMAEFRREVASEKARRGAAATSPSPSQQRRRRRSPALRPLGTRVSARLRGEGGAEEWQPIPDEWLAGEGGAGGDGDDEPPLADVDSKGEEEPAPLRVLKTGLESDLESVSELTDLSENSPPTPTVPCDEGESAPLPQVADPSSSEATLASRQADCAVEDERTQDGDPGGGGGDAPLALPADFIEWETICVTLYEWEHIAERFEKATHYAEKALHSVLVKNIVPVITESLREIERKRRLEAAVMHRKRSSRIAIKESEREEARVIAKKKAEDEELLARARRRQARLEKEEAERTKRENAREQRKREREAKELLAAKEEEDTPDTVIDVVGDGAALDSLGVLPLQHHIVNGGSSGTRTPAGEDWELDCEICFKHTINQDDGSPIMCCSSCSKWQHILCHDSADLRVGRPKRNWDVEDFVCRRCRKRKSQSSASHLNGHSVPPQQQHVFLANGSLPPSLPDSAQPNPTPPAAQTSSSAGGFVSPYIQQPINGDSYLRRDGAYIHHNPPGPPSSSQPNTFTFAHYQPHQHGFSIPARQPQTKHGHVIYGHTYPPPSPALKMENGSYPTQSLAPLLGAHPQSQLGWPTFAPARTYSGPPRPSPAIHAHVIDDKPNGTPGSDLHWPSSHAQVGLVGQPQHLHHLSQPRYHQGIGPAPL